MNKAKLTALFGAVVLLGSTVLAQEILGPGLNSGRINFNQVGNKSLTHTAPVGSADYILTGTYFVTTGNSITIAPGTVIYGDSGATLVINKGAQIHATGTSANPIVFTSKKPAGQRAPGDWGGVVILGNAPTNQINPQIEGGIIPGFYGGPDPNDNSGEFQYCRIEFPGFRYQINNEINGLTMGGVGAGTKIDHVQVSYSSDDSYEWFGGTVNCKYLVAYGGTDDEFDTDFGYSGKLQFLFAMRDPNVWDPTGESNGYESDNEGTSPFTGNGGVGYGPRTTCKFANVTMVGPQRVNSITSLTKNNRYQYSMVLRRLTRLESYNTVVCGYPGGVSIRDSLGAVLKGVWVYADTTVGNAAVRLLYNGSSQLSGNPYGVTNASVQTYFNGFSKNVAAASGPDALQFTSLADLINPDPRPQSTSPLVQSGNVYSGAELTGFDAAAYVGAFNTTDNWMAGWTKFDLGVTGTSTTSMNAGWNLVSLPRIPTTNTPSLLWPGAEPGTIYSYDGTSYTNPSAAVAGQGYWALYTSATTNSIAGTGIGANAVNITNLPAGSFRWVLLGSVTSPALAASISAATSTANVNDRIQAGTLYGYDGTSYVTPTTIVPGKGYWILVEGLGAAPGTSYFLGFSQ